RNVTGVQTCALPISPACSCGGVRGKNLTEWQFGLASIKPRWNVSGSYMQVIPRFVSTDAEGNDEREFLTEAIPDYGRLMSLVFQIGRAPCRGRVQRA